MDKYPTLPSINATKLKVKPQLLYSTSNRTRRSWKALDDDKSDVIHQIQNGRMDSGIQNYEDNFDNETKTSRGAAPAAEEPGKRIRKRETSWKLFNGVPPVIVKPISIIGDATAIKRINSGENSNQVSESVDLNRTVDSKGDWLTWKNLGETEQPEPDTIHKDLEIKERKENSADIIKHLKSIIVLIKTNYRKVARKLKWMSYHYSCIFWRIICWKHSTHFYLSHQSPLR